MLYTLTYRFALFRIRKRKTEPAECKITIFCRWVYIKILKMYPHKGAPKRAIINRIFGTFAINFL